MRITDLMIASGKKPQNFNDAEIRRFVNDSRLVEKGDMFIAIKTENDDGHKYIPSAYEKGAVGVIASHFDLYGNKQFKNLFLTKDTIRFISKSASELIKRKAENVIGITGSAGKTTTKELTAHILKHQGSVQYSEGNFNNTIGLPMTVLNRLNQKVNYFVAEMGMSYPGEIESMIRWFSPNIRVWLNVLSAHLGNFRNLEELREAKAEVLLNRSPEDIIVYNEDDILVRTRVNQEKGLKYSFGFSAESDLQIIDVENSSLNDSLITLKYENNHIQLKTHLAGKHNCYNIAASVLIALLMGMTRDDIIKAVSGFFPVVRRGVRSLINDIEVFDDCYNSNPDALKSVVELLDNVVTDRRKILVTGDMLELGDYSRIRHEEIGQFISGKKIDIIVFFGSDMKYAFETYSGDAEVYYFEDSSSAAEQINTIVKSGDQVVVKSSRGMTGELIIDRIKGD